MNSHTKKPIVAISSCLLGENVRYDGGNKRDDYIIDVLGKQFEFLPVCPEVSIGLGVPRSPIQMMKINNKICLRGLIAIESDFTDAMQRYSDDFVSQCDCISGYIFKSKSPSCGLSNVPVYNLAGEMLQYSAGMFAGKIVFARSELPVIDEQLLMLEGQAERFIKKVYTYQK